MDHEVVPRSCKICDWLLNSSQDHFGLHQVKKVKVIVKFKVPKKHMLRPTLSSDKVQMELWWEMQKRCSSKKKVGPHGKNLLFSKKSMNFLFCGREGEENKRQKNGQTSSIFVSFSKLPFLGMFKKNQHIR